MISERRRSQFHRGIEVLVCQQNLHLPFKAIIDLNDGAMSAVYAPLTSDPSTDDLAMLNWINDRIVQLGSDPHVGQVSISK